MLEAPGVRSLVQIDDGAGQRQIGGGIVRRRIDLAARHRHLLASAHCGADGSTLGIESEPIGK